MKKLCLILALALVFVLSVVAAAEGAASVRADVIPIYTDPGSVNLKDGYLRMALRDEDKIETGGYFTIELYELEIFNTAQIKALAPGNTVQLNGKVWTVKEMVVHDDGFYEMYPVEEYMGYMGFLPDTEGFCVGIVDDWSPVFRVGEAKIMLPLPDKFAFYTYSSGEEDPPVGFDGMLKYLEQIGNDFVPYNTEAHLENGVLTEIRHTSYPVGPEE